MSLWPEDGHYHCDRCGADCENGGPQMSATIITTRRTAEGRDEQVRYDLCRDQPEPGDPKKIRQGCEDRVLTRKALRTYRERQQLA